MGKFADHRKAVASALKKRDWSAYRLHKELVAAKLTISQNQLYTYLRGDVGLSVEKLEAINKLLGIRYTDE